MEKRYASTATVNGQPHTFEHTLINFSGEIEDAKALILKHNPGLQNMELRELGPGESSVKIDPRTNKVVVNGPKGPLPQLSPDENLAEQMMTAPAKPAK